MEKFAGEYGRKVSAIDDQAIKLLRTYSWPGNIRELRNVVLRAIISAKGSIRPKDLPEAVRKNKVQGQAFSVQAGTSLPDVERVAIIKTLQLVRGNKLKTAELLGISRRSLYNKLEEYRIEEDEYIQ